MAKTLVTISKADAKVAKAAGIQAVAEEKAQAEKTFIMKNVKPDTAPSKFNLNLTCGDCLHYKGSRNPKFDGPCSTLGIGSKSEAPSCYTPDVTAFRSVSKDTFPLLAVIASTISPRQARVLMGMLKYAGTLERVNLTFLQECFFTLGSTQEAYLDDYCRGYAAGVDKHGSVIVVGSGYLQGAKGAMIAYLDKGSVLTAEKFGLLRKQLVGLGKIRKPSIARLERKGDYEVPTIDDEPNGAKGKGERRGGSKDRRFSKEDLTIRT